MLGRGIGDSEHRADTDIANMQVLLVAALQESSSSDGAQVLHGLH